MTFLSLAARAKINLFLRVVGARDDGYHEIETVMQSVELLDELTVRPSEQDRVVIEWAEAAGEPLPPPGLVERAVEAGRRAIGGAPPAEVRVVKRIPAGAGLGGGSADAAAAILGLGALSGEMPSLDPLMEAAAAIGSDVPFALTGGTALATGRGEVLREVLSPATLWWVIAVPEVRLSTAEVYRHFDARDQAGPSAAGDSADIVEALASGEASEVASLLSNDLEPSAFELAPLDHMKAMLIRAGALRAVMSGSGSAMAGLCLDADHADRVAREVGGEGVRVWVAPSASRGAEILRRG